MQKQVDLAAMDWDFYSKLMQIEYQKKDMGAHLCPKVGQGGIKGGEFVLLPIMHWNWHWHWYSNALALLEHWKNKRSAERKLGWNIRPPHGQYLQ